MDDYFESTLNKVELTSMEYAIQQYIGGEFIKHFAISPECSLLPDIYSRNWILQIKQRIFGEQVLYEEATYPKDWWQAFKERWFPAWMKRRWPIAYNKKTFDARYLYPSINHPHHSAYLFTELKELSVAS